jgi:hypothetical protein
MGNLPLSASCVAAISPSVAAGTIMNAKISPKTGRNDSSVPAAMYRKNSPDMARGCCRKVLMPSLTQVMPVLAGTILSFMVFAGRGLPGEAGQELQGLQGAVCLKAAGRRGGRLNQPQPGGLQNVGLREPLAQDALEMAGVVRLEHRGFARQMEVPQA